MTDRIKELQKNIKEYRDAMKKGVGDFQAETWMALQLKEWRKELRSLKNPPKPLKPSTQ